MSGSIGVNAEHRCRIMHLAVDPAEVSHRAQQAQGQGVGRCWGHTDGPNPRQRDPSNARRTLAPVNKAFQIFPNLSEVFQSSLESSCFLHNLCGIVPQ